MANGHHSHIMAERLLTPEDVAELLRVPVRSLKRGKLRREMPWIKIGRELRMLPSELARYQRELARLQSAEAEAKDDPARTVDPKPEPNRDPKRPFGRNLVFKRVKGQMTIRELK